MRLYAISGSLRRSSSNRRLLEALACNAPQGLRVEICNVLSELPIFNPDLEGETTHRVVSEFAARIADADGLIISCPEYAHGIPGGLKNALDWLVSRAEIPFKPVLLVHASHRGDYALAALSEVLKTMSVAQMPGDILRIPLLGKTPESIDAVLSDPSTLRDLKNALEAFTRWIAERAGEDENPLPASG